MYLLYDETAREADREENDRLIAQPSTQAMERKQQVEESLLHSLDDRSTQQGRSTSANQFFVSLVDDSPKDGEESSGEAQTSRRALLFRALFGEFFATSIYYIPLYGCLTHAARMEWDNSSTIIAAALVSGLQLIGAIMCFSNISGAHVNPAISFALWVTGKLSNRKLIFYVMIQLLASICSMLVIMSSFENISTDDYRACAVIPDGSTPISKIFFSEFFCTFLLTYVCFTVALDEADSLKKQTMSYKYVKATDGLTLYSSTPQSSSGFAPFAIGFTVLSLVLFGGSSGVSMNPRRMFGPALFSNNWRHFYVYVIAELLGAALAALICVHIQHTGFETMTSNSKNITASHRDRDTIVQERPTKADEFSATEQS